MPKYADVIPKREGGARTRGCTKLSQPNKPLISIITVVYNGEKYLEQAILSVLNQTYDNIEYLIIDGGSTDKTIDIINRYDDRIDYWVSEPDNGIYDAMNKGIDLVHGELVGVLNSDDYYELETMRTVAEHYSADTSHSIFYGNNYVLQDDLNIRYKSYPNMHYWLGMPVCHQAMFVPKYIYQQIGKYVIHYKLAADYDFLLKSIMRNIVYTYIDEFLVNYRGTGASRIHYLATMAEWNKINKIYFKPFNRLRYGFLVRFYRTIIFFYIQKIIVFIMGKNILQLIRSRYIKIFIAKDCGLP